MTTKKVKKLDRCKSLIDKRCTEGLLSEVHHKKLSDLFTQAKSGKWSEAGDRLYKFRASEPFPK